jgi:hypothetical protein
VATFELGGICPQEKINNIGAKSTMFSSYEIDVPTLTVNILRWNIASIISARVNAEG